MRKARFHLLERRIRQRVKARDTVVKTHLAATANNAEMAGKREVPLVPRHERTGQRRDERRALEVFAFIKNRGLLDSRFAALPKGLVVDGDVQAIFHESRARRVRIRGVHVGTRIARHAALEKHGLVGVGVEAACKRLGSKRGCEAHCQSRFVKSHILSPIGQDF